MTLTGGDVYNAHTVLSSNMLKCRNPTDLHYRYCT